MRKGGQAMNNLMSIEKELTLDSREVAEMVEKNTCTFIERYKGLY